MELLNGYKMTTTFPMDFSIADKFGCEAVKNTYKRAFKEWNNNYVYLTELVITLNQKIWEHHGLGNTELAEVYNDLWEEADDYAMENLKGDELKFFLSITD